MVNRSILSVALAAMAVLAPCEQVSAQTPPSSAAGLGIEADEATKIAREADGELAAGHLAEAADSERDALDLRVKFLGRDHPDTLRSLATLALIHQRQAHLIEAELITRYVLAARTRVLGPRNAGTLASARALADLPRSPGAAQAAGPRPPSAAEAAEIARLTAQIAEALREDRGSTPQDYAQVEPSARRLHALRTQIFGVDHPNALEALIDLGRLHQYQQHPFEAAIIYRQVLDARLRLLGAGNAATIRTVGVLLGSLEFYPTAEYAVQRRTLLETSLAAAERSLGPSHRNLTPLLDRLAALGVQGAHPDRSAEERYRLRSLHIKDSTPGFDRYEVYSSIRDLTFLYEVQHRDAEAEPYYLRLISLAEQLFGPDHWQTLSQVRSLAECYRKQHRYADAERLQHRVVEGLTRTTGATSQETASAAAKLATIQQEAGRPVASVHAVPPKSHDDEMEAAAEQVLAARRSYDAGQDDFAEPAARQALTRLERLAGADDPATLGAAGTLANIVSRQGRLTDAEQLYRRVLDGLTRRNGPDDSDTIVAANNLGTVYMAQGRYAEAQPLFERALQWADPVVNPDAAEVPAFLLNLAALYRRQQRDAEAEPLIRSALRRSQLGKGRDDLRTIEAVTDLAGLLRDRGNYTEARALAERALASHDTAARLDHPARFAAMALLASIDDKTGRPAEADALYRQALGGRERVLGVGNPATLQSVYELGVHLASHGHPAEAMVLHRRAYDARLALFGREHPDTLGSAEQLTAAALAQAGARGTDIDVARLLLDGTRARRDHAGASQWARAQDEREAAIAAARFALFGDAAWSAQRADPAQATALRAEAFGALQDAVVGSADRSIAEAAARRYADTRHAGLAELIRKRQDAQATWAKLDGYLSSRLGAGSPRAAEEAAAIRKLMAEYEDLISKMDALVATAAPDYFSLVRPTPVSLAATQALLGSDEVLLLTVPSRLGTHVVAVTHDQVAWNRSDLTATAIRAIVQQLRWDASYELGGAPGEFADTRLYPRRGRPAYRRALAWQLYRELIAPVAGSLTGKHRVYIAAGGALAGIPFSILVSAPPAGRDDDPAALRATHWFGDDYALIHIPSVRSLALLRQSEHDHRPGTGFLGIGNPVLAPEPAAATTARGMRMTRSAPAAARLFDGVRTRDGGVMASPAMLRGLPSLPGSAVELERVRVALDAPPASLIEGAAAIEPRVRAIDYTDIGVLLFSTHGATMIESGSIGEAGLVLTPPPGEAQNGNDGYLAASEVALLHLNADWVILSACNTATGDGIDNPGLGQLSRAFFYAGARNLLASHWPVADEVSPQLITQTLALEKTGMPRAEAFRRSMRAIRMNADHDGTGSWAHPFFWAPFVLIGDGGH